MAGQTEGRGLFSAQSPYPLSPTGGIIQSPAINDAGKPTQHAIKDVGQARDIARTIIAANRHRQIINSRILAKYNAEKPYDSWKLEAEGLGWKQNFTTKPLPSMIEKVAPRFVNAVNGLKYLTNSSLSEKYEKSTEKTEKFREVMTRTMRERKGWRTLVEDIAFDNALFGHTVVACLDEYTWFPTHFNQDENFLPDGCKQLSSLCQFAVLKETALPHELFARIQETEEAKTAGYNLDNCRDAINRASPTQIRDMLNVGGTYETWYQNALRELVIGASYMAGASVVIIYHVLAREVTGKVSHYQLAGPELLEIFSRDDRFDSMEDFMTFFAYQKGNRTVGGSKGIGRDIYELAGMIDRTRNEVVDRAILSGKTLIQGDVKRIHTFKLHVIGATMIIPTGWQVLEQKMDGNIEPFLKLDAYFQMLVDQLIGNVSTPNPVTPGEGMRSPAAWNLMASREEESKDARITRFLEQFTDMVGMMQRRICNPDTTEEDAKAAQKELLEVMSREELDILAKRPVAGTVRDLTPMERQMISAFSAEKKGNPLYNQRALEVEDGTARVGADFLNKVLLPDNDPTEQAEQSRLQQMELALLTIGQPVPVSPRDNHMIHMSILFPVMEQQASHMLQGGSATPIFEVMVAHLNEHANRAEEQGADKEKLKPILDFLAKAGPAIAALKEHDQAASQLQQLSQAHDEESQHLNNSGLLSAPAPAPQQ